MPTKTTLKVCLHCHTQFRGGNNSHYCPDCRYIQRECLHCGKLFVTHRWRLAVTCSYRCGQLFRWRNAEALRAARRSPCANCGGPITRKSWAHGKHKAVHNFCSLKYTGEWQTKHRVGEYHPNWHGGRQPYYGPSWSSARKKARQRDNYTCQQCGITEAEIGQHLYVHHIVAFQDFGLSRAKEANALSNLITLCHNCHILFTWHL